MSEHRAYSLMTITKADAEARVIEGTCSVPRVDRVGDIVEPLGGKWTLPLPFLHQHDHTSPIGWVEWLNASAEGVRFRARLAKVAEPGTLRDRLETAWGEIKSGLVRAVSIGFRILDAAPTSTGLRIHAWELFEISSVTIPACEQATIDTVKRLDSAAAREAKPHRVVRLSDPVPGARKATAVVRLDAMPAGSRPVAMAMKEAMELEAAELERAAKRAAERKSLGSMASLIPVIAAGAKAADAQLAALAERIAKLERRD